MNPSLDTPVTVFFYRRPDHLKQVLARVREASPKILFGVSDGPKPGREESRRGVEESRRVFRAMVDWPCRWRLLEREINLGSYLSVSRGLDEILKEVPETLILEDDTVPDPTFFRFGAELLERFRSDERVGSICGSNFDDPATWQTADSYRFTRYHHGWGWATWARAWKHFDREEKLLARLREPGWRRAMGFSREEWAYWERCWRRTYALQLDAWDYRWSLSLWLRGMFCVIPRVNLVRNIGFDALGTHTLETDFAVHRMHEAGAMDFPLRHPARVEVDAGKDRQVFARHYQVLEGRRNPWEKLRDAFCRMVTGKKK